jgi:hypothetical protein
MLVCVAVFERAFQHLYNRWKVYRSLPATRAIKALADVEKQDEKPAPHSKTDTRLADNRYTNFYQAVEPFPLCDEPNDGDRWMSLLVEISEVDAGRWDPSARTPYVRVISDDPRS